MSDAIGYIIYFGLLFIIYFYFLGGFDNHFKLKKKDTKPLKYL
jgi:hypothetical protein